MPNSQEKRGFFNRLLESSIEIISSDLRESGILPAVMQSLKPIFEKSQFKTRQNNIFFEVSDKDTETKTRFHTHLTKDSPEFQKAQGAFRENGLIGKFAVSYLDDQGQWQAVALNQNGTPINGKELPPLVTAAINNARQAGIQNSFSSQAMQEPSRIPKHFKPENKSYETASSARWATAKSALKSAACIAGIGLLAFATVASHGALLVPAATGMGYLAAKATQYGIEAHRARKQISGLVAKENSERLLDPAVETVQELGRGQAPAQPSRSQSVASDMTVETQERGRSSTRASTILNDTSRASTLSSRSSIASNASAPSLRQADRPTSQLSAQRALEPSRPSSINAGTISAEARAEYEAMKKRTYQAQRVENKYQVGTVDGIIVEAFALKQLGEDIIDSGKASSLGSLYNQDLENFRSRSAGPLSQDTPQPLFPERPASAALEAANSHTTSASGPSEESRPASIADKQTNQSEAAQPEATYNNAKEFYESRKEFFRKELFDNKKDLTTDEEKQLNNAVRDYLTPFNDGEYEYVSDALQICEKVDEVLNIPQQAPKTVTPTAEEKPKGFLDRAKQAFNNLSDKVTQYTTAPAPGRTASPAVKQSTNSMPNLADPSASPSPQTPRVSVAEQASDPQAAPPLAATVSYPVTQAEQNYRAIRQETLNQRFPGVSDVASLSIIDQLLVNSATKQSINNKYTNRNDRVACHDARIAEESQLQEAYHNSSVDQAATLNLVNAIIGKFDHKNPPLDDVGNKLSLAEHVGREIDLVYPEASHPFLNKVTKEASIEKVAARQASLPPQSQPEAPARPVDISQDAPQQIDSNDIYQRLKKEALKNHRPNNLGDPASVQEATRTALKAVEEKIEKNYTGQLQASLKALHTKAQASYLQEDRAPVVETTQPNAAQSRQPAAPPLSSEDPNLARLKAFSGKQGLTVQGHFDKIISDEFNKRFDDELQKIEKEGTQSEVTLKHQLKINLAADMYEDFYKKNILQLNDETMKNALGQRIQAVVEPLVDSKIEEIKQVRSLNIQNAVSTQPSPIQATPAEVKPPLKKVELSDPLQKEYEAFKAEAFRKAWANQYQLNADATKINADEEKSINKGLDNLGAILLKYRNQNEKGADDLISKFNEERDNFHNKMESKAREAASLALKEDKESNKNFNPVSWFKSKISPAQKPESLQHDKTHSQTEAQKLFADTKHSVFADVHNDDDKLTLMGDVERFLRDKLKNNPKDPVIKEAIKLCEKEKIPLKYPTVNELENFDEASKPLYNNVRNEVIEKELALLEKQHNNSPIAPADTGLFADKVEELAALRQNGGVLKQLNMPHGAIQMATDIRNSLEHPHSQKNSNALTLTTEFGLGKTNKGVEEPKPKPRPISGGMSL